MTLAWREYRGSTWLAWSTDRRFFSIQLFEHCHGDRYVVHTGETDGPEGMEPRRLGEAPTLDGAQAIADACATTGPYAARVLASG